MVPQTYRVVFPSTICPYPLRLRAHKHSLWCGPFPLHVDRECRRTPEHLQPFCRRYPTPSKLPDVRTPLQSSIAVRCHAHVEITASTNRGLLKASKQSAVRCRPASQLHQGHSFVIALGEARCQQYSEEILVTYPKSLTPSEKVHRRIQQTSYQITAP